MLSTHFIIGVTESWANENIEDAEIGIDGYDLFRDDRPAGHKGGGVVLYVNCTLNPMRFNPKTRF